MLHDYNVLCFAGATVRSLMIRRSAVARVCGDF